MDIEIIKRSRKSRLDKYLDDGQMETLYGTDTGSGSVSGERTW